MAETMKVVNLEAGMPTVATAKGLLSQSLRTARANGTHLVKLIHGYGSTGKGGSARGKSGCTSQEMNFPPSTRTPARRCVNTRS